jgi:hypothetical protein
LGDINATIAAFRIAQRSRMTSVRAQGCRTNLHPVAFCLRPPQEKSTTKQKTDYPHQSAADRRRDQADTTIDRLKGSGERAQEMALDVAEQAREYGEKAQLAARQFKPFVEKSLKEQPMTTLAGAAVVGF